ncbi:hypothetical protein [Gemmata sp.]|uniref:hypothetical protein n=1 Tax=Gemmata sp. TaxID=1914242 RepID=UPI003F72CC87
MYTLLVALLIGPDVARLGSDSYGRRECAEQRLRALGPLAWAALLDAERSADPEVRHRAARLLAPYRAFRLDLEAAGVLCDPWPMSPGKAAGFHLDECLRRRVHRLATAAGCHSHAHLLPENTPDTFWSQWPAVQYSGWALESCRKQLGHPAPGWPFK